MNRAHDDKQGCIIIKIQSSDAVRTNNKQSRRIEVGKVIAKEGYNSKLRHKKTLGLHPNVYLLASVIKDELGEAHDDGDSASFGIEVVIIL